MQDTEYRDLGMAMGKPMFSRHYSSEALFGEVDLAFRGLSLASSIITMILIYNFSQRIYRSNTTGFIASFIFPYSQYSIEFGTCKSETTQSIL